MNKMNDFFENFILQRKMYFNICKITNYGEYYFSSIIKTEDWNYFVPYGKQELLKNIEHVNDCMQKNNRKTCIAVPTSIQDFNQIVDYLNKENYKKLGTEQWLIADKHTKIPKLNYKIVSNEDDLNLFKYILISTYSNLPSNVQSYANLPKEYLDVIENLVLKSDEKNIILFKDGNPISACTLCIDEEICGIYNLAVLPKYQDTEYGYNVLFAALKEYKKLSAQRLFIQTPEDSLLHLWLKKNNYKESLKLHFYAK